MSNKERGRPRKEFDKRQFENLCGIQCTEAEICEFFETTDKTLNKWCNETYGKNFSEVFKEKRGKGKVSLRRTQWEMAKTNPTMAIFLGKQYLGQRDVETIHVSAVKPETVAEVERLVKGE